MRVLAAADFLRQQSQSSIAILKRGNEVQMLILAMRLVRTFDVKRVKRWKSRLSGRIRGTDAIARQFTSTEVDHLLYHMFSLHSHVPGQNLLTCMPRVNHHIDTRPLK